MQADSEEAITITVTKKSLLEMQEREAEIATMRAQVSVIAALRARVAEQAAEIERLKAELIESEADRKRQRLRAVSLEMSLHEQAGRGSAQKIALHLAQQALAPALPLARATYALTPDPAQTLAAAIVAAAEALGVQDGE